MKTWSYIMREEYMDLGLRGFELAIYAIISSYSQGGQGCYYGGLPFLSFMAGCHVDHARRCVKSLAEKGLVKKETIVRADGKYLALSTTSEPIKCPEGCGHNVRKGAGIMSGRSRARTYIIENNNKNNNTLSNERDNAHTRETSPRFQKPTQEEVRNYICDRNSIVDPEAFYAYYESNGWKVGRSPMKDWHAAVVTWEKRERARRKEERRPQPESVFEHNLRVLDSIGGTNYHEELYGPATNED